MSDETKLHAMAVLTRRKPGGPFSLVVRWLLGTGEALPRRDDAFKVRVVLGKSRNQLTRDGSVLPPNPETWIEVRPRNYAMLEPPRSSSGAPNYQMVAVKPNGPVDPAAAANGSLNDQGNSKAVGVIHLLEETEPSREAWRIANAAAPAMRRALFKLQASGRTLKATATTAEAEDPADRSARALARFLVAANVRPMHLPQVLTAASARLRETALAGALRTPEAFPSVFALQDGDFHEYLDHAALVATALNDRAMLDILDQESTPRKQTRQQLRLRALQGGKLLDYWCSPDVLGQACVDGARGATYSSAELIGTGLEIGGIPEDLVRQWVADGEVITIKVQHDASGHTDRIDHPLTEETVTSPGNLSVPEMEVGRWEDGDAPLLRAATEIQSALDQSSSHPPPPPAFAEINYDLTQSDAGRADDHGTSPKPTVTFETGEGKVQILIKPPESVKGSKTVYAFNLYGMWEENSTARFFADHPDEPKLDDLRPWRISARYSYTRDLAPAFPSGGASPHKALMEALADPPWFPILERPDKVYEPAPPANPKPGGPDPAQPSTQPLNAPLPQVGRDNMTATSIDLRKGMLAGSGAPAGVMVRWDPFGPLNTEWTPAKRRNNSDAGARPQRYRFWVTSVDAFEQESAPVPVRANDDQAGETAPSYIYTPRFRLPIGAPPQLRDEATGALSLPRPSFDESSHTLTVSWETPFVERVAVDGRAASQPPRIDKSQLLARVALFRKRLLDRVDSSQQKLLSISAADLSDEPQWRQAFAQMKERGFEHFKTVDWIDPPMSGDVWIHGERLAWADRGFEYVAGVNFRIRGDIESFWAPNVTSASRRVVFQTLENGEFKPSLKYISEIPRSSDVSLTDATPIINDAEPRGATLPRAPNLPPSVFAPARPVPAVARTRRDLVLLRLLSHGFKDAAPNKEQDTGWLDTGVYLTPGRAAMCESAIRRTFDPDLKDPDFVEHVLNSTELKEVRRLLAEEFGRQGAGKPLDDDGSIIALRSSSILAHHSTLGFRGIQTLNWSYKPFAAGSVDSSEAEAVAMRVYQVRVPIGNEDAVRYATFQGKADRTADGNFRFSQVEPCDVKAMEAIASLNQPAVCRLAADANDHPQFLDVAGLDLTDPAHPVLRTAPPPPGSPALSASVEVKVFGAQPISLVPVDDFEQEKAYSLALPVGGGEPEMFFWWVSSVSAQGREAGPKRRIGANLFGPMSIEPDPPLEFESHAPTDPKLHKLDPQISSLKPFIPQWIWEDKEQAEERAHNNPRLLLTWNDPSSSSATDTSARIVIYRQWKNVSEHSPQTGMPVLSGQARSAWQALKAVEAAKPGEEISTNDLTALKNWLLGETVAPEDEGAVEHDDLFIDETRGLSSTTGLVKLTVPSPDQSGQGTSKSRPGFIDYFYDNKNPRFAMEGSRLYRYMGARAIDLDPTDTYELPPGAKYLLSRPTNWTPFRLPETTATQIELVGKPVQDPLAPSDSPVVVLLFTGTPPPAQHALAYGVDPSQLREWSYQIIVRRRIDRGLPPGPDEAFEPQWIEVGTPGVLKYGGTCTIYDLSLDRQDYDTVVNAVYRISVTQTAVVVDSDGTIVERRQVRNGAGTEVEITVTIPEMKVRPKASGAPELLGEWRVTQTVAVY